MFGGFNIASARIKTTRVHLLARTSVRAVWFSSYLRPLTKLLRLNRLALHKYSSSSVIIQIDHVDPSQTVSIGQPVPWSSLPIANHLFSTYGQADRYQPFDRIPLVTFDLQPEQQAMISVDPDSPDLRLRCKDGRTVQAHSCILMMASTPLRSAIEVAINPQRKHHGPADGDGASGTGKRTAAGDSGPATVHLPLPEDDADVWEMILKFLDINCADKPDIVWVSHQPRVRAHPRL